MPHVYTCPSTSNAMLWNAPHAIYPITLVSCVLGSVTVIPWLCHLFVSHILVFCLDTMRNHPMIHPMSKHFHRLSTPKNAFLEQRLPMIWVICQTSTGNLSNAQIRDNMCRTQHVSARNINATLHVLIASPSIDPPFLANTNNEHQTGMHEYELHRHRGNAIHQWLPVQQRHA